MPSLRLLAPALFALAMFGAAAPASADSFSDAQRTDIEAIIKNYLVTHPEVLEEAMTELTKRQAAAETQKHEASIAQNSDAIFNSPRQVVLKEFPVLSQGSVEAAQVAVAVRMQDPTGKKYLDFHQKLLGGRGAADKARALQAAKEAGLDTAQIEKDIGSPEVRATIEENFKLAEAMGMNGTPSYVIGKQIVIGAVGLEGLKEKIGVARCGKATC